MLNYCWVLFLLAIPALAVGQKAEKAHQLGLEGIALVDKGLYSDGIKRVTFNFWGAACIRRIVFRV